MSPEGDDLEPEKALFARIYGYVPSTEELRRFHEALWAPPTEEERRAANPDGRNPKETLT